ncbi:hypothetical protein [Burkholderia ubonensis]|nr:hypothetical protein [Burkholderia ubonensis]
MDYMADTESDEGMQHEAGFGKPFGRPFAPAHDGLTQVGDQATHNVYSNIRKDCQWIV